MVLNYKKNNDKTMDGSRIEYIDIHDSIRHHKSVHEALLQLDSIKRKETKKMFNKIRL